MGRPPIEGNCRLLALHGQGALLVRVRDKASGALSSPTLSEGVAGLSGPFGRLRAGNGSRAMTTGVTH